MALTIDRLTDRARQNQVASLEREYFDWVNSELGSQFGIALDTDTMIANDLAELEISLPPDGAVLVASDDGQLSGMVFLTRCGPTPRRSVACTCARPTAGTGSAQRCSDKRSTSHAPSATPPAPGEPALLGRGARHLHPPRLRPGGRVPRE